MEERNMLKGKEQIYLRGWACCIVGDDYENGEALSPTLTRNGVEFSPSQPRLFASVNEAIEDVCRVNGLDFKKNEWIVDDSGPGEFRGCIAVNSDGDRASNDEISAWKKGKKKLWACYLSVSLSVVTMRHLKDDEMVL